jgi:1-acyl-sn-glycerol-3-phosphate acyltransferase
MKRVSPMASPLARLRAFLITDPLIVVCTILYGTASLLVSFFDPARRRQNAVERAWARALLLASGVKVKVEGLEKMAVTFLCPII